MKKILFLFFLINPSYSMSYETAQYEIIKKISDNIEIRKYNNLLLAEISQEDSQNSNFRALFKFISGGNSQEKKISMTTPVFQETRADNNNVMSFVMPGIFNQNNMPQPTNKNIKIKSFKNSKFIVIEFSGRATDSNFKKYKSELEQAIKENEIRGADLLNPINAYYNSPWTLPFLKRNEVLLKLKDN
jgi:hypothetical protein